MRCVLQNIARISRRRGQNLLLTMAICAAVFGFHAARDWHRHGEIGAGLFHLHHHVGQHDHRDHDHPTPPDHDHDSPDNTTPARTAVFTLVSAIDDGAPVPLTPGPPGLNRDRASIVNTFIPRKDDGAQFSRPRAPPA